MKKLKNKIILLLALTVLLFVSCANGAKDAKPEDIAVAKAILDYRAANKTEGEI